MKSQIDLRLSVQLIASGIIPNTACKAKVTISGIFLVAVVLIAVIASAFIPNFWVVSTTLLLTLMALIALRELLYHRDYV
jgi:hypothetical protein